MKQTSLFLAAALTAGFASFAQAQTTQLVEIDDKVMVAPFNVDVDRLEDMDIYNAAGQKIGDIEEVVGPDRNTPQALVIDFDDNAGYGNRDDVIIPIDRFSIEGLNLVLADEPAAVEAYEIYRD